VLGVAFAAVLVVVLVIVAAPAADGPASAPAPTTAPDPLSSAPTTGPRRSHSGALLVVGDSLTVGADLQGLTKLLKADGWQPTIDAEEGRSTTGAIAVVQQRIKVAPPLVIVELGTNPGSAIATFAPSAARRAWDSKRRRWSSGSLSSVKALAISTPPQKASQRSTSPSSLRWRLASGESSTG